MSKETPSLKTAIFSLKWWQAAILLFLLIGLTLAGGWAARQGAEVKINADFQVYIDEMAKEINETKAQINIPVNSTVSAMVKEANYIIAPHSTYYCLFNGTDDRAGRLEFYSTNKTLVEQYALGNMTSGLLYLKDCTHNSSLALTSTQIVCQSYSGVLQWFNTRGTVLWTQLAADPSTAGWGQPEQGYTWYNTVEDTYKYWNGSAVVTFPSIGGGSASSYTLPFTYTVYKTGSTYYAEKYDGTLTTSTNASAVLNNAVGNLSSGESSSGLNAAAKAGSILVLDAYYNIDTRIGLGRQTKIQGSSMMTVFNVTANTDCFWINNGTDDSIYSDWEISNLQIDMNQKSGNGIYGVWPTHTGNKWGGAIDNVIIREIKAGYAGISLGQTMLLNIQHVRMDTYGTGIYLYNSATNFNSGESYLADIIIGVHNGGTGLKLEGGAASGNDIINALEFHRLEILDSESGLSGTGQTGVNITWGGRMSFYNSIIEYMDYGVWIQSDGSSFSEDIQFINTGMWGIKNTAVYMVSGTRHVTMDGGQIYMAAGSSYVWYDGTNYAGTDYASRQNKIKNVEFGGGLTITNAMLRWGIRTEVFDCTFYNDTSYPPPIAIALPFASFGSHYGIFLAQGTAATPTNTTTYITFNTEYYITVSGGTGVNVTIAFPSGGTKIIDAAATLTAFRIPRSWTFTCTWTTAPTVTVWGV